MFFYYIYNKDKKPFSSFIFLFWAWIGMKYQRTVMQQEVRILFFNLIIVQNLPTLIALSCFIYIYQMCKYMWVCFWVQKILFKTVQNHKNLLGGDGILREELCKDFHHLSTVEHSLSANVTAGGGRCLED